jgi:hypothetical protein
MGSVRPMSRQITVEFGGAMPDRTSTGASTAGVRTPPSALPTSSRTNVGAVPDSSTDSLSACGGGVPSSTHVFSWRSADRRTKVCWPLLIGTAQPSTPSASPSWALSACAVPATSHRRKLSLSGWRAGR